VHLAAAAGCPMRPPSRQSPGGAALNGRRLDEIIDLQRIRDDDWQQGERSS